MLQRVFITVFILFISVIQSFGDSWPITLDQLKKHNIGVGAVLVKSIHGPSMTVFQIVSMDPKFKASYSVDVVKREIVKGKPDEIVASPCIYTFPPGETTITLSANYDFLYKENTAALPTLAKLFGKKIDRRGSIVLSKEVRKKINSCLDKTEEEILEENQKRMKLGQPRILPRGIGGIEGDKDNYIFFQNHQTYCLEGDRISFVKPTITYTEDAPLEWGNYHVNGCQGHLVDGISGMKKGKVLSLLMGPSDKSYRLIVEDDQIHVWKMKKGKPVKKLDTLEILISSDLPIERFLYKTDGKSKFGYLHWAGDLNHDQKIDILFDTNDGGHYGGCNAHARLYFSTEKGYVTVDQPMGGCL